MPSAKLVECRHRKNRADPWLRSRESCLGGGQPTAILRTAALPVSSRWLNRSASLLDSRHASSASARISVAPPDRELDHILKLSVRPSAVAAQKISSTIAANYAPQDKRLPLIADRRSPRRCSEHRDSSRHCGGGSSNKAARTKRERVGQPPGSHMASTKSGVFDPETFAAPSTTFDGVCKDDTHRRC